MVYSLVTRAALGIAMLMPVAFAYAGSAPSERDDDVSHTYLIIRDVHVFGGGNVPVQVIAVVNETEYVLPETGGAIPAGEFVKSPISIRLPSAETYEIRFVVKLYNSIADSKSMIIGVQPSDRSTMTVSQEVRTVRNIAKGEYKVYKLEMDTRTRAASVSATVSYALTRR